MINAIIPARGGSKGIPRKNLMKIKGETLIARCVRTCRQVDLIDEVWVSTDDEEIASEAEDAGGQVIIRSPDLATDSATSQDVLLAGLDYIEQREQVPTDVLVFAQCTSPLATPDSIKAPIVGLLSDERIETAISVARFDGLVVNLRTQGYLADIQTRRQDRPNSFVVSGESWAIRVPQFIERGQLYGGQMALIECVTHRLEIDRFEDLELARKIIQGHVVHDPELARILE